MNIGIGEISVVPKLSDIWRPNSRTKPGRRDTGLMRDDWLHIGRLWTSGERFLAIDSARRGDRRGDSDEEFDRTLELTPEETGLAVGMRMAALVGGDGAVRDDSWIEVFPSESGVLAFVQVSGPDYRMARAAALACPDDDDLDGAVVRVDSGELAVFTAAADGDWGIRESVRTGAGPVPAEHGSPSRRWHPGACRKLEYRHPQWQRRLPPERQWPRSQRWLS